MAFASLETPLFSSIHLCYGDHSSVTLNDVFCCFYHVSHQTLSVYGNDGLCPLSPIDCDVYVCAYYGLDCCCLTLTLIVCYGAIFDHAKIYRDCENVISLILNLFLSKACSLQLWHLYLSHLICRFLLCSSG